MVNFSYTFFKRIIRKKQKPHPHTFYRTVVGVKNEYRPHTIRSEFSHFHLSTYLSKSGYILRVENRNEIEIGGRMAVVAR